MKKISLIFLMSFSTFYSAYPQQNFRSHQNSKEIEATNPDSTKAAIVGSAATVTGKVLWNELPVQGSEVQIKDQGNYYSLPVLASDSTDILGEFAILNAPSGDKSIYATAPSAEFHLFTGRSITIPTDGTIDRGTFYLSKFLELVAPAHNSTISTRTPNMVWNSFPGAVRYHVNIFNDETGAAVLRQDVFEPTTSLLVSAPLTPSTRYQWSVDASNSQNNTIAYRFYWFNVAEETEDMTAPGPPSNLVVNGSNPSPWQKNPDFLVEWNEPVDESGIDKALYKIGSPPAFDYDTTGSLVDTTSINVQIDVEYGLNFYLWFSDKNGNVDFQNRGSVTLFYDISPPIGTLANSPDTTETLDVIVSWDGTGTDGNGSGLSGIYDVNVQVNGEPFNSWLRNFQGSSTFFSGEPGKTYGFEAAAHDVVGNVEEFLGIAETNTIIDSNFANAAPSVPTNLQASPGDKEITLSWNANTESDFLRYRIYGATAPNPTSVIDSVNGISNTSKVISGLNSIVPYSFRLTAIDGALLESGFSNEVSVTPTNNLPPVINHAPLSIHPADQAIIIEVDITDDGGIASASLKHRRGGDVFFDTEPMSNNGSVFQGRISAIAVTSRGIEYHIEVTDNSGLQVRMPILGEYTIQISVPIPGIDKRTPQPGGSEQTAYRLISMPIDLEDKNPRAVLEDDLGEYDNTNWRFYDERKSEYPNTALMASGKAFWLIVKDSGRRINTGAGKSNPTGDDFDISIHPQWNLIGNPFNFSIPVSNLSLSSVEAVELRTYTGSWNDPLSDPVTTIQPFEGYAIFNSSSTNTTLSINPDLSSGNDAVSKTTPWRRDWSLRIIAQNQAAIDEDNFLGLSSEASQSWDEFDRPEPPVIGEFVSVYFPHSEWGELSENYCTDFRPEISESEIWEFEVMTNIRDVVHLSFEGFDAVPNEYDVWLLDPILQTSQDLRRDDRYSVAASVEHPKHLQLLIGRTDFVHEKLATSTNIPQNFELSQNYPNPFNPTTTIRYGLPKEEKVTLRIYNILGEEVVTLVNEELKAAGFHAAVWDGRNSSGQYVASGVFIYQLKAAGRILTSKMALVR